MAAAVGAFAAPALSLPHAACKSAMQLAYGDGSGIIVVAPTGKVVRRLTRPPSGWSDADPSWSPDGKRVAFDRFYTANPSGVDLEIVRASGGKATFLTYALGPSWSPQGDRLLVERTNGHDFWDAMLDPRRPSHEVDLDGPAVWSPDGGLTFFGGDLILADRAGGHRKRIWRGDAGAPAWSPDGTRVAFVARNRRVHDEMDLWSVDADGSNARILVRGGTPGAPVWSPDGSAIAFPATSHGRDTIEIVRSNGRGRRVVEPTSTGDSPAWSPDGKWLSFVAPPARFTSRVFVMHPDGTDLRRLPDVYTFAPTLAWRPCSI